MRRSTGRRPEPRIVDPNTHPRREVSLIVAADFLAIDTRTLLARVDAGEIPAWQDGRVWRFVVNDLVAYKAQHRLAS